MKQGWSIAFGILGGLLGAGLIYLISRPPHGQPIELIPAPTFEPVQVHVAGNVQKPGLYILPYGSRVKDALEAAGGVTNNADTDSINLASILKDGGKVFVPQEKSVIGLRESNGESNETASFPIDINAAEQETLELLPNIGPKTALAIIEYRNMYGAFESVDDLVNVSGIGPVTLDQVRDLIIVYP